MLAAADPGVRTVVLVNDFASVGVDGSLLKGRGADVVELPNGCICCSLRSDLARQLQEAIGRWAPQRVLIEPSGVADVAALLGVLERPGLKELVKRLTVHGVIEVQMQLASALILNTSDLVPATELRMIATTLRRLNPRATITPASYGLTQAPLPEPARLYAPVPPTAAAQHDDVAALRHSGSVAHDHAHADGHTRHGHDHDDAVPGLSAWSAQLDSACDPAELEEVLHAVASGRFGAIERVKGIARAGAGWVHFDVAGGRPSIAAFVPHAGEEPRVVAIGRAVDEPGLRAAFAACMAPAVA
jgi:G3E family GTPase